MNTLQQEGDGAGEKGVPAPTHLHTQWFSVCVVEDKEYDIWSISESRPMWECTAIVPPPLPGTSNQENASFWMINTDKLYLFQGYFFIHH